MPPRALQPHGYERRRPEETALYQVLQEHLETFIARTDEAAEASGSAGLPRFVKRELRGFLRCGILAHGFARLRCPTCHDDILVPLSCRGRGFCPSCCGRRMVDTAAHLVDRVIPEVPVRHWVLSFPFQLRYRLAYDADLRTAVLRVFIRAVTGHYRREAKRQGIVDARCGAVTAIQRAGDGLRLNLHFHSAFLDGVYSRDHDDAPPRFHCLQLADEDVERVVTTVRRRVLRLLVRRGLVADEPQQDPVAAVDPLEEQQPLLAACYQAAVQGRIATGERAGAGVRRRGTWGHGQATDVIRKGKLSVRLDGFDLHAATRIKRHRRADLERLCRYMLRPPIATERLYWRTPAREELVIELKRSWSDGTTALVMSPMELIEKLVPLIPATNSNQVRYHGVLAPGSKWRKSIVATLAGPSSDITTDRAGADGTGTGSESLDDPMPALRPRRLGWAQLLKRVLDVDVVTCRRCQSSRKIIAFIQETSAARQILQHLGLPHRPPPIAPARPPPQHPLELP